VIPQIGLEYAGIGGAIIKDIIVEELPPVYTSVITPESNTIIRYKNSNPVNTLQLKFVPSLQ